MNKYKLKVLIKSVIGIVLSVQVGSCIARDKSDIVCRQYGYGCSSTEPGYYLMGIIAVVIAIIVIIKLNGD